MWRKPLELAGLNFVSYFFLTLDIRSVAQANIVWSIGVNLVLAMLAFTILKRIQEARTIYERLAYALGGTTGTVVSILLTKAVFHK